MTDHPPDRSDPNDPSSLLGTGSADRTIMALCVANAELGALVVSRAVDGQSVPHAKIEALATSTDELLAALGEDVVDPPSPVAWARLRTAITNTLACAADVCEDEKKR